MDQYKELPKTYDPASFEDRIYAEWCEKGYFTRSTQLRSLRDPGRAMRMEDVVDFDDNEYKNTPMPVDQPTNSRTQTAEEAKALYDAEVDHMNE